MFSIPENLAGCMWNLLGLRTTNLNVVQNLDPLLTEGAAAKFANWGENASVLCTDKTQIISQTLQMKYFGVRELLLLFVFPVLENDM